MTKGWSNVKAYRCRAAHMVDEETNIGHNRYGPMAYALCGSPVRTLVRPRGAPVDWCDHCERKRRSLRKTVK